MLPKETGAGEIAICAGVAAGALEIPVPLSAKLADACALRVLVTETFPAAGPPLSGLNSTLKVAVVPGFRVNGRDRFRMLNPGPVTVAVAMVTGLLPGFEIVATCAAVVPSETLPNVTPVGENAIE